LSRIVSACLIDLEAQLKPKIHRKSTLPVKLTESGITKATKDAAEEGVRKELVDAGCAGLRLRIAPSGRRNWMLACRDRYGRMRRFMLGDYDDMGLADARTKARALRVKVRDDGEDPTLERKRDRAIGAAARAGEGTLKAMLVLYEEKRGSKLKSWSHSRKRVDLVFSSLMDRPVATLTTADFQMAADSYKSSNSAAFAVRTIRPALKWCAAPGRNYVKAELALLSQPESVKPRKRVLSRDELTRVLPALKKSDRPHARCIRLLMLTLTRLNEAAGARWGDFDLEAMTWSVRETKNDQPHTVPLSRQALALLEDIKPKEVARDTLVFATAAGTLLGNWDRETKAIHEVSKTSLWHRHDLRRTGATMLGEMGELPDIIEAALNHTSIRSPLAATYNRSRYRPQVATALQRLADALDSIEAGGGEIVPIARPA
jgi:integrase